MELSSTIGELCSDVSHIKKTVDNGLSAKLSSVEKSLDTFISADKVRVAKLDAQNWFSRLLEGSVKKVIGIVLGIILLNGFMNAGMWAALKTYSFNERPGQQQAILINSLGPGYHSHVLSNGQILLHANDQNKPAWIWNKDTNSWDRSPDQRIDRR